MQKDNDTKAKIAACNRCLCRTCANLSNPSVICGNTEAYCKSLCSGGFADVQECSTYKPKETEKA